MLAGLGLAALATSHGYAAEAGLRKASDWLGHTVTTRDGKELGTVRDFAIDDRGRVIYIVVSVGSFLIENNLIAVAPDALVPSRAGGDVLELEADPDALVKAQRFASDSRWPAKAEVLRGTSRAVAAPAGTTEPTPTVASTPSGSTTAQTGTATIESRSKTAHLSAGERYIKDTTPPAAPPPASKPKAQGTTATSTAGSKQARLEPITKFDRLDVDGDGVLNRSEFAPVMSRSDRYTQVDINANGVIELQEFDVYETARAATN